VSWFLVLVRRLLWLLLIAAVGGAVYSWWRDRSGEPSGPAEWPPLPPRRPDATPAGVPAPTARADAPAPAASNPEDAPATDSWVPADDEGSCPLTHPIKANDKSGIFHVPDGRFYDRTKAQRCYPSADAAVADGYRQAKS
jgi:hypothetical protein